MHARQSRPAAPAVPGVEQAAQRGRAAPHLLVEVLQLLARQLQVCHLRQHEVPPAAVDVCQKALYAVHSVERHLALVLKGRGGRQMGAWQQGRALLLSLRSTLAWIALNDSFSEFSLQNCRMILITLYGEDACHTSCSATGVDCPGLGAVRECSALTHSVASISSDMVVGCGAKAADAVSTTCLRLVQAQPARNGRRQSPSAEGGRAVESGHTLSGPREEERLFTCAVGWDR